ncbi:MULTISPECIES: hypothetical protein [Pseudofrankia]|uniref:hypothetical protein n=1 Tax=Pseudofrankia TaxID=2994363 RepID=UPI000234CE4C|nr:MULTISPECIES: hypothetical protein [Pseudofrankia]OHV33000.1 hypothetical protein BCD49_28175 [Pseudofrankia sp. EUN1h]
MADALFDAIRLFLDQDEIGSKRALVTAVRQAEDRWEAVCVELSREETARADMRPDGPVFVPELARRRILPAQRTSAGRHSGAFLYRAARPRTDDRQLTRHG